MKIKPVRARAFRLTSEDTVIVEMTRYLERREVKFVQESLERLALSGCRVVVLTPGLKVRVVRGEVAQRETIPT